VAAAGYRLTVRDGPRVEREDFPTLEGALSALERRTRALADSSRRDPVDLRLRKFEPAQQVAARTEVAGPGRWLPAVRGGVDVRGDGSLEAFVGGLRRKVIEQREGESAFAALRRELGAG